MIDISGKKLKIKTKEKGLKKEYSGNNNKLLKTIGNFKFIQIEQSITELYNWYKNNEV